jgi:hypothetical protein
MSHLLDSAQIATWFILTEAAALSAVAMVPYAAWRSRRRPQASLLLRTLINAQWVFGLAALVGLAFGPSLGLEAPLVEALVAGTPISFSLDALLIACAGGVGITVVIWILDVRFFPGARSSLAASGVSVPPPLLRVGALLYGAIAEEVLMRFGILTFAAGATELLLEAAGAPERRIALVSAVGISTGVFALGHLPTTAQLTPLTRPLVLRSILLNGLAGVVFGTLFCVYGLEAAMIGHGSADVMILFAAPLLRRRLRRA